MKSSWKIDLKPKLCFRQNFLKSFRDNTNFKKIKPLKSSRFVDDMTLTLGGCKKFRLFTKLVGFNVAVWSGNKFNIIPVSTNMVYLFVGSFVFTKRFTRDIHKKQVQTRNKRAFNKKK